MRNLRRNTQPVYYKLLIGEKEIIDEYGNVTGSPIPLYGELQKAYLSVSPNKGSAETDMFGTLESYDRTMTTADVKCPIDESTILWLDGADTSTDEAHNYVVTRRAPWKNTISFAIRKVTVKYGKEGY